jgi:hypothetical protein
MGGAGRLLVEERVKDFVRDREISSRGRERFRSRVGGGRSSFARLTRAFALDFTFSKKVGISRGEMETERSSRLRKG